MHLVISTMKQRYCYVVFCFLIVILFGTPSVVRLVMQSDSARGNSDLRRLKSEPLWRNITLWKNPVLPSDFLPMIWNDPLITKCRKTLHASSTATCHVNSLLLVVPAVSMNSKKIGQWLEKNLNVRIATRSLSCQDTIALGSNDMTFI